MMRRAPQLGLGLTSLGQQKRSVRYSNVQDTLMPSATEGRTAGTVALSCEVCINGEGEEERKRPAFLPEALPKRKSWSYLSSMYRWGFDSLTLFRKPNEDPGPWWNANSGNLVSTWTQVGDNGPAGLWSGVWKYTYGITEHNQTPDFLFRRAFGGRDKNGALRVNYDETGPAAAQDPKVMMIPHTKEHQLHQRLRNPPLPGVQALEPIHYKRGIRECQYHLGQGIRFYVVDGVFGNHDDSSTPYRIITDNADHAYFAQMSALRKFNYVAGKEVPLVKRANQAPIDEWAWRRPGVLIYHCPSFDLEAPRIVEEFGGPRPQDMSMEGPKFTMLDPYAIPMKAAMAGQGSCDALRKTTAFLCSRWGFYADGKRNVTLNADGVLQKNGERLTVVVSDGSKQAAGALDKLRASPLHYSAESVRIGGGLVTRCWDSTSLPLEGNETQARDMVEESEKRIQRPLSTLMGAEDSATRKQLAGRALSHRLLGRRSITQFGYKRPHNYTTDAATVAALGGHLFSPAAHNTLLKTFPRPAAMKLEETDFVVIGAGAGTITPEAAAKSIVESMGKNGWLYAEAADLEAEIAAVMKAARSVKGITAAAAAQL